MARPIGGLAARKACVRFQAVDDLALDAIGRAIAGTTMDEFIAHHEASRRGA